MLPAPDQNPEVLQGATEEALNGETLRSNDWLAYSHALRERRKRLVADLEQARTDGDDVEALLIQVRLDEADEQIRALEEEANISRFVEDAVKFSYEVRRLNEG